jgi:carotenoid cleavage dioxygenase-like enzyme
MSQSLPADTLYSPDATGTDAIDNLYLHGPFAPVQDELDSRELRVQGQIPPALNGLYVRIGPNPMKQPKAPRYHWFTGDGMVHGVRLQGGQASWYRNRYIGSKSAQKALGRPTLPGDTRGIFDTVNTNVFAHAGRIWASVEAGPAPVQLNGALACSTAPPPCPSAPTLTSTRSAATSTPSATTRCSTASCSTCASTPRARSTRWCPSP